MLLYSLFYIMDTDGSMNFSNITTNFNLVSNPSFYDILSTIVTDGTSNKIQLISSDPNGVFYGNAFVLGQLLIQFSVSDTSANSTSSVLEQIIYFPYSYSATPYTMFLNGLNNSNTQLMSYNKSYFSYTTNLNSQLNFMAIGPLPVFPFPSSINMNETYDVTEGGVTWNISSNGTTTMTATYTTNITGALLSIYRPYKSIEYTIIGGGGGGGGGSGGVNATDTSPGYGGGAGGGGGGGQFIDGSFNNMIPIMFTGIVAGSGGDKGNGGDGSPGYSSYFTYNYEDISEEISKDGGAGGTAPYDNTLGGSGGSGGTNSSQPNSGHIGYNGAGGGGGSGYNANSGQVGGSATFASSGETPNSLTCGGGGGSGGGYGGSSHTTGGGSSEGGGTGGESGKQGVDGEDGDDATTIGCGGGGGGGGWANSSNNTIGGSGGNGASGSVVFVVTF